MLLREIPFIWQYIKKKDYLPTFWTKIWHFGSLCTVLAHRLRARISAPRGNLYLKLQEHCLHVTNVHALQTLRLYGCYFFWLLRTILKEKEKWHFCHNGVKFLIKSLSRIQIFCPFTCLCTSPGLGFIWYAWQIGALNGQ